MKPEGLRDIHGPVALPGDWWWLWVMAGFLLVVLVVWCLWRVYRRFQRPAPAPIPVPPWERALAALDQLEQMRFDGEEAGKNFYFLLSGVIRTYIEERFNIRAPEMTTEEFMECVRRSPDLLAVQQDFLAQFLSFSDMVKFACYETRDGDRVEALATARRFVEGSIPVIETPPKGEKK